MNAREIMALAQAHRREGGTASWHAFYSAVRGLEADRDAAVAEVARLTPLQFRQAPCHKFCEATAFEIEIRQLRALLTAALQGLTK